LDTTEQQEQLSEIRELWDEFKDKVATLLKGFEKSPDTSLQFTARRFYAYNPNFDPGYDAGMGMNLIEFFDEWQRVLEGAEEDV